MAVRGRRALVAVEVEIPETLVRSVLAVACAMELMSDSVTVVVMNGVIVGAVVDSIPLLVEVSGRSVVTVSEIRELVTIDATTFDVLSGNRDVEFVIAPTKPSVVAEKTSVENIPGVEESAAVLVIVSSTVSGGTDVVVMVGLGRESANGDEVAVLSSDILGLSRLDCRVDVWSIDIDTGEMGVA